MSNGCPPSVAANLTVKLNTSPASRLGSTASTAYNNPLTSTNITAVTIYQASLGTSRPGNTANSGRFNASNDFYQVPLTVKAPSPASSCNLKSTSGTTYSPFSNTFSTINMFSAHDAPDQADSRSNPHAITSHSFKRKADTGPDTPTMETLKRVKAMDTLSTTELSVVDDGSLPMARPSKVIVQELPNSGNPQTGTHTVKRNVGGRPRTAPPKQKKLVGPTRLRKNKPVAADVHMDIWELILPYCPLRFLFTARNVNKHFQERLAYSSLWKKCRIQNYGTDMPDPLPGMMEWDYANLVEGLGCMSCQNKRTRKTYWAFQKRWCAKCLVKNTILVCIRSLFRHDS